MANYEPITIIWMTHTGPVAFTWMAHYGPLAINFMAQNEPMQIHGMNAMMSAKLCALTAEVVGRYELCLICHDCGSALDELKQSWLEF